MKIIPDLIDLGKSSVCLGKLGCTNFINDVDIENVYLKVLLTCSMNFDKKDLSREKTDCS